MVEEQRRKLETEITKLVDDLDRSYLRKMQSFMHKCAANCCDNPRLSMESVQNCIENCSNRLTKSNNYVQQELQHFQTRVQRCVMDCNDEIRDKMGGQPKESDIEKFGKQFEACAVRCVDKHLEILPNLHHSMRTVLAKEIEGMEPKVIL